MTRKTNRLRVGVIGLGVIGSRAAANLRSSGHQVYVWNRTPRAEPNFLGSPAEVTDLCDTLQIFVADDAALLETVRAVAPALKARHLVLAHPTVSPETAREAAGIVEKTGARYVDAPFAGSRAAAGNGELVYYIAGPEPARRDALPVLEATSKNVVVIGDTVGQAMVTKIATNLFTATIVQSLAEALALARAAGIEPARFTEAMEHTTSRSGTSDFKLTTMLKGDYATPHFALKHMLKDTRLALRLAAEHGLTLPTTATVTAQLYGADRRGWGDMDFAALAKNYDPALPAAVVPPTVIPEILPPAPAPVAFAPAPALLPAPPAPVPALPAPPTLGLPPTPAESRESSQATGKPAAETVLIPRAGLPFPPAKKPAPSGEAPDAPGTVSPAPAGAAPKPTPEQPQPAAPGENLAPVGKPGESSPGETSPPPTAVNPPPEAAPPPAPDEKSVPFVLPAALPDTSEPEAPESPRPPATRRTLLSWFQKGK